MTFSFMFQNQFMSLVEIYVVCFKKRKDGGWMTRTGWSKATGVGAGMQSPTVGMCRRTSLDTLPSLPGRFSFAF